MYLFTNTVKSFYGYIVMLNFYFGGLIWWVTKKSSADQGLSTPALKKPPTSVLSSPQSHTYRHLPVFLTQTSSPLL